MDYTALFNKMIQSLEASPLVNVLEDEFFLKEATLPALLEQHPQLKPITESLRVLNDNVLVWAFAGNSPMPAGELHFYALEQTLALPPVGNKLMIFEDHPEAGDGLLGCIKLIETGYELWLFNENGTELKLELDLPTYLKELVTLKAIYGWQYLFAGNAIMDAEMSVVRSSLKERIERLKATFPDEHFEAYLQKLI